MDFDLTSFCYTFFVLVNNSSGDFMGNEVIMILFRVVTILCVLFVLTKLMGKKQLSQMNIYDYLVGITIGNVAADISVELDVSFLGGILALCIYSLFGVVITGISMKSLGIRKFFSGVPTILMENGNIIVSNMKKEGMDIDSLEEEARLNGYFDLSKINYAILETNGQISFLPKVMDDFVTNGSMKLKVKENELGVNLIQDGVVIDKNLEYVGKDNKWLDKFLKKNGYDSYKDVFLLVYKNDKDIAIYNYDGGNI